MVQEGSVCTPNSRMATETSRRGAKGCAGCLVKQRLLNLQGLLSTVGKQSISTIASLKYSCLQSRHLPILLSHLPIDMYHLSVLSLCKRKAHLLSTICKSREMGTVPPTPCNPRQAIECIVYREFYNSNQLKASWFLLSLGQQF